MRRLLSLSLAFAFLGVSQAASANDDEIKVETRNIYLGADLTGIVESPPEGVPLAAREAFDEVVGNDFPLRAEALADEIAKKRPHLIGLQEVTLYRCQFVGDSVVNGTVPAEDPCKFPGATLQGTGDYLVDLLTAVNSHPKLVKKGITYIAAASVENADFEVPMFNPFSPPILPGVTPPITDVRLTDRDVVLARSDVLTSPLVGPASICGVPIPNPLPFGPPLLASTPSLEGCNFTVNAPTPLGPPILRGFVGVDAVINGHLVRFVDTHLEVQQPQAGNPASSIFQSVQAAELIGTVLATTPADRKLIVLGDINSSPEDAAVSPAAPYAQFVATGFEDAWTANDDDDRPRRGFTCCQQSDLGNPTSELDERIDTIFLGDPAEEVESKRVGQKPAFDSQPFWASDHAGVVAEIEFDDDSDSDSDSDH